jgi:Lon protease-like protein
VIEAKGTTRFRVIEKKKSLIGLWEAKVDLFDDELESVEIAEESKSVAVELYNKLREQVGETAWESFKGRSLVANPENPKQFSFWVAHILPVPADTKKQFLEITSTMERLLLQLHCIHSNQENLVLKKNNFIIQSKRK